MPAINMNLGQYVPTGSIIHRLDPRAKLFSMLILISAVFPSKTYWGVLICAGVLAVIVRLSNFVAFSDKVSKTRIPSRCLHVRVSHYRRGFQGQKYYSLDNSGGVHVG